MDSVLCFFFFSFFFFFLFEDKVVVLVIELDLSEVPLVFILNGVSGGGDLD